MEGADGVEGNHACVNEPALCTGGGEGMEWNDSVVAVMVVVGDERRIGIFEDAGDEEE